MKPRDRLVQSHSLVVAMHAGGLAVICAGWGNYWLLLVTSCEQNSTDLIQSQHFNINRIKIILTRAGTQRLREENGTAYRSQREEEALSRILYERRPCYYIEIGRWLVEDMKRRKAGDYPFCVK